MESALDIDDGHTIDPSDVSLEEKQLLESIHITGLRELPVETEGVVLEVDPQPLGPILGIRFRSILRTELDFLRAFVSARVQGTPPVIPMPVETMSETSVTEDLATDNTSVAQEVEVTPDPLSSHAQRSIQMEQRLKRFRTLALVMPPGHDRETLSTFLATQGFTRVLPAGTLAELAMLTRKSPPDIFLVDWPEANISELDIVHFLGNHPFPLPPRILLACMHATTQFAREANRLGVSHLLVKPYSLDASFVELLFQQLSGDEE